MKENRHTPAPSYTPAGVERLLLAERDAVLKRDWRAATRAATERAALKESFRRPRVRRSL